MGHFVINMYNIELTIHFRGRFTWKYFATFRSVPKEEGLEILVTRS